MFNPKTYVPYLTLSQQQSISQAFWVMSHGHGEILTKAGFWYAVPVSKFTRAEIWNKTAPQ